VAANQIETPGLLPKSGQRNLISLWQHAASDPRAPDPAALQPTPAPELRIEPLPTVGAPRTSKRAEPPLPRTR
jgi:hypothetical protein